MNAIFRNCYCKLLVLLAFGFLILLTGLWIGSPHSEASLAGPDQGGFVYQNFETQSGLINVWNGTANYSSKEAHSGVWSLLLHGYSQTNGVGIAYQRQSPIDFNPNHNDRLTFWISATPPIYTPVNNVAVTFFDTSHYTYTQGLPNSGGAQVWTTQRTRYQAWTQLTVLFDQLPPDFDLQHVTRLEFTNYWPGTYYLDDIQVVHEDCVYQSFEPDKRGLSVTATDEFGWVWNGATNILTNTCNLSGPGDPVHEGQHSWKIELHDYWAGTGIKSEQEYFSPTTSPTTGQQSFWNVNLDPKHNDQLSFWVYAVPANGLDNNVNIQFFDRVTHAITVDGQLTFTDKVEY